MLRITQITYSEVSRILCDSSGSVEKNFHNFVYFISKEKLNLIVNLTFPTVSLSQLPQKLSIADCNASISNSQEHCVTHTDGKKK